MAESPDSRSLVSASSQLNLMEIEAVRLRLTASVFVCGLFHLMLTLVHYMLRVVLNDVLLMLRLRSVRVICA